MNTRRGNIHNAGIALRWSRLCAGLLFLALALAACGEAPVAPIDPDQLLSRGDELARGRSADSALALLFAIDDGSALARYVDSLGQALAVRSDDPALEWSFRVIDSPSINVYPVAGGRVYVTRGLLAYVQNEAQLVYVLCHAIAHITARHTAHFASGVAPDALDRALASIAAHDVHPLPAGAETGLELLCERFTASEETAADAAALRLAFRFGYSMTEAARMLETMEGVAFGTPTGGLLPWQATHEAAADRIATVRAAARLDSIALGSDARGASADAFVWRLDGLVYHLNPASGIAGDGRLVQPRYRFSCGIPAGWGVAAYPTVIGMRPLGSGAPDAFPAALVIVITPGSDPYKVATAFNTRAHATVLKQSAGAVHGLGLVTTTTRISPSSGEELRVSSAYVVMPTPLGAIVCAVHGIARASQFAAYEPAFATVIENIQRLDATASADTAAPTLSVFPVSVTAPFSSLVHPNARVGLDLDGVALLNQCGPNDAIAKGRLLKEVR